MSSQNDPSSAKTTIVVVLIAGLVAIIIVCMIGSFITLNTLINRYSVATWPSIQTTRIGFDFTDRRPEDTRGDISAASHLFIHNYPMPEAGFITGVTYLNDCEIGSMEIPETITLLILRPTTQGWKIIHRVTLPADDNPPATTGITSFQLDTSLPVEKGDIFAHWQSEETGPILVNYGGSSIDGLSNGKFGFDSADIEVGQVIIGRDFNGQRDYFINLFFEPAR